MLKRLFTMSGIDLQISALVRQSWERLPETRDFPDLGIKSQNKVWNCGSRSGSGSAVIALLGEGRAQKAIVIGAVTYKSETADDWSLMPVRTSESERLLQFHCRAAILPV